VTISFRKYGYQEQTVHLKPGASGNLEASVTLERDPAIAGKPVAKETPKS
jgi:hypothetical protein